MLAESVPPPIRSVPFAAEHANFEHICVNAGIVERDRSVAVNESRGTSRRRCKLPPLKLIAAARCTVAAKNLNSGIVGNSGGARKR